MGNIHVSPVSRLWNTNVTDKKMYDSKTKKYKGFIEFEDIHKIAYKIEEHAEDKIEK